MLVRELIDRLESSGMLDREIIDALRQQLEESGARVTPEAVVKLLVDNGHLTRFQATKLIGELRSGESTEPSDASPSGDKPSRGSADSDLVFADEAAAAAAMADDANESAAILLDDDDDVIAEAVPDDELVAEAVPVEAEAVVAEAVAVEDMASLAPHPVIPPRRDADKKNVWDSIWIYGVAGLIVFLLGVGGSLVYVMTRTSAEEFEEKGNKAYTGGNFVAAKEIYTEFLKSYPNDKGASQAKVRIGISEIILAKDSVGDPGIGLEKARTVLPTIENEPAFDSARADAAGVLVEIGTKIAEKADSLKVADDKDTTLKQLQEWFSLIENPMYMTSNLRQNFGPRITGIEETRGRVERDIARDRALTKALAEMRSAIAEKATKKAYDIRMELVRQFPRLLDHPELASLVLEASAIQRDLVTAAAKNPVVSREPDVVETNKTVLLTNLTGSGAADLIGRVVYFKVRGAVMALEANTGQVLWRRYVGYDTDNPPVALGDRPNDGVLLSDGRKGELLRVANNKTEWRAVIGESFSPPIVDGETVYTTTESGILLALDTVSGATRWAQQIPQTAHTSPGLMRRGAHLYQMADHSNLYVLSSQNGSCIQSFYIGHDVGTARVPAVALLGHLFVIENRGSDYCLVHILRIDDTTGQVSKAQDPVRLDGNVTTSPEVQERRLIVLTDRGQIVVLDVELSAEGDKVSKAAEKVASYDTPTESQMVVGRNEMWVTGARIGRFDLQINTGKVIPDWVQHEADTFIAKPMLIEGVLLHARRLRGTQGVRITAARPQDGTVLWQNDVGMPIAMVVADQATKTVYGVTSQAALYDLNRDTVAAGYSSKPLENPGGDGIAKRFERPLSAGNGKFVIVNQEASEQLAVFDPNRPREKLRLVTLSIPPGSKASPECVLMSGGVLMPMDNGRVILMNWESGGSLGSPFQPPAKPGEKVTWTTPIINPSDPEQLLIGDSRAKLYRLRVAEQIRELSSGSVSQKFIGPAAASGANLFAAASGTASDSLVTYSATSLEESGQRIMSGRIVFGPVSVGDIVLLQTADNSLQRIDADAKTLWSFTVPSGSPVAAPLLVDGQLLVTGADGWIVSLDPNDGRELGRIELAQPLAGNPLVAGGQLLVPGSEGVIYLVARP